MPLKLHRYPDPILLQPTKEVTQDILPEILSYLTEFVTLMRAEGGVGLAANQAGIPLSFAAIDLSRDPWHDKNTDKTLIMFNPKILSEKDPVQVREGCLSLPGFHETVTRPSELVVEYRDEKWELKTKTLNGLMAQCCMHEMRHLQGLLTLDDVSLTLQQMYKKKLQKRGLL